MRYKVEIYHYERKIDRCLERIKKSSISGQNRALILSFYEDLLCRGLSDARVLKYLTTLKTLSELVQKPFSDCAKADIANLVRAIEAGEYTPWTKHDYKVILKIFYRWLRGTEEYPEEVKWIKTMANGKRLLPESILTEEEVKKMVESAATLRDKAFILVLYESGCRIGELLTLRIKDLSFDEYGGVLFVSGKTGDRRVRVIASTPKLTAWLEIHPLKNNPDAPLWVNLSSHHRFDGFGSERANDMLKETAKAAGISKRVYPHLFRHSRATYLAKHLTEAQMKQHFGWVQGSDMASTYVHLSGRDVDEALLKLQGIKVEHQANEETIKVKPCLKCSQGNSIDSKFCVRCGAPLDVQTIARVDELRSKADKLMSILISDPNVMEKMLSKIEEMQA